MRIQTPWGSTQIDPKTVYKLNCIVEVWARRYVIELFLANNGGTITTSFGSFEELVHNLRQFNDDIESASLAGPPSITQIT